MQAVTVRAWPCSAGRSRVYPPRRSPRLRLTASRGAREGVYFVGKRDLSPAAPGTYPQERMVPAELGSPLSPAGGVGWEWLAGGGLWVSGLAGRFVDAEALGSSR